MKVTLYSSKEKQTLELPVNIEGSFILTDNNQNQIASINSENNDWVMSVSSGVSIIQNGSPSIKTVLSVNSFYYLKSNNSNINNYIICTEPDYDESFKVFQAEKGSQITFGKDSNNNIVYNNPYINDKHIILQNDGTSFQLVIINNGLVALNDIILQKAQTALHSGDILTILGLKIIVAGNYLIINNPAATVQIRTDKLKEINIPYKHYQSDNEN